MSLSPYILRLTGLVVILVMFGSCSKDQSPQKTESMESVSISTVQSPPAWLIIVALKKGFFTQEGLNVTSKYYPSGKRALEGMFKNQIDVATCAGVPVINNIFKRSDYSIFGVIGRSYNDNKIVADKTRGILSPMDLKGKRIATQHGAAAHFFLHLFLLKHQIDFQDIQSSFMKVEKLPQALEQGRVDAISTREPALSKTQKLLGERAITFEEPRLYTKTFNVVAHKSFIRQNPHIIRKILRALIKAAKLVEEDPDQVSLLLAKHLNLTQSKVLKTLSVMNLSVALDQPILSILADQARWAQSSKLTTEMETPDLLEYIDYKALLEVQPDAVTIIR